MANRGHLGDGKTETEWDMLQRTIGAFRDEDGSIAIDEEKLGNFVEEVAKNIDPLEYKSLEQLDELEDDEDEEILNIYRKKRIEEMKAQATKNKFGELYYIQAPDWKQQVTEVKDAYVVVLLWLRGIPDAELLRAAFLEAAGKWKDVKFVQIKATDAIPNYPQNRVPTVLLYKDSNIAKQWIGISSFGGSDTNIDDLEWELSQAGVIKSDMLDPPRGRSGHEMLRVNIR
eukprot:c12569_g1_i2.p1 GENE.c12569_g1_i2~~c12569_g1_i2.p1  ORF type:complete len:229 (-),score=111.04 c12569_g1_i2:76-762(-)